MLINPFRSYESDVSGSKVKLWPRILDFCSLEVNYLGHVNWLSTTTKKSLIHFRSQSQMLQHGAYFLISWSESSWYPDILINCSIVIWCLLQTLVIWCLLRTLCCEHFFRWKSGSFIHCKPGEISIPVIVVLIASFNVPPPPFPPLHTCTHTQFEKASQIHSVDIGMTCC